MQLSETVKLYPTKYQRQLIVHTMNEYIATVNRLVVLATSGTSIQKFTTADVQASLPSALKNQCIRDAKSIVKKHYKSCHKAVLENRRLAKRGLAIRVRAPHLPILKKPCFYVNNQNFKVESDSLAFPVLIKGKSTRISVSVKLTERQRQLLQSNNLGTLRVVIKNQSIVAQVVYEVSEPEAVVSETSVMGLDLGIKCPAVSYCSDGAIQFYGNGRKNKYIRRQFAHLRKKLQTAKKPSAVVRINNKEQRVMKDIDHKISREIVNHAVRHGIKTIKMEQLENIRSTTRKSRKNNHSLHTWSFYRLAKYIEYKAKLAGISVEYVNPAYTSQRCPVCGQIHHADDRNYLCSCGYHTHRDIVGAKKHT